MRPYDATSGIPIYKTLFDARVFKSNSVRSNARIKAEIDRRSDDRLMPNKTKREGKGEGCATTELRKKQAEEI